MKCRAKIYPSLNDVNLESISKCGMVVGALSTSIC